MRKNTLEERDIELISRYYIDEIVLISYFDRHHIEEYLQRISETFRKRFVNMIKIQPEDRNLDTIILEEYFDKLDDIQIDITNASTLHSSVISNMATRFNINIYYQSEDGTKMHLMHRPYYYDDATKSEIEILRVLNGIPRSAEQIRDSFDADVDICRSNLYKLLESMADRGIIDRGRVDLPPDYKRKHPFGYLLNKEQMADLRTYLCRHDERIHLREQIASRKNKRRAV